MHGARASCCIIMYSAKACWSIERRTCLLTAAEEARDDRDVRPLSTSPGQRVAYRRQRDRVHHIRIAKAVVGGDTQVPGVILLGWHPLHTQHVTKSMIAESHSAMGSCLLLPCIIAHLSSRLAQEQRWPKQHSPWRSGVLQIAVLTGARRRTQDCPLPASSSPAWSINVRPGKHAC